MNERRVKARWKATVGEKEWRFEFDPKDETIRIWRKFRKRQARTVTMVQLVETTEEQRRLKI